MGGEASRNPATDAAAGTDPATAPFDLGTDTPPSGVLRRGRQPTKSGGIDMAEINRPGLFTGAGSGAGGSGLTRDWNTEESWWRDNWSSRRYASGDRGFDYYRPGYRYGFESANRYRGREWNDVESDLRTGWNSYEHRGQSTWEDLKDAVRDAWDRVTGKGHG
jgi:hypothetical protein